jgi:hypothetical protein
MSSKSQSGQAVIEYLLTLIVTVSIILGILFQFSSAFQAFAGTYFGEYVKCLIKEGELPNLQVKTEDKIPTTCEGAFEAFTLSNGRPPKEGSSKNNSGGANSSKNKKDRFKDGNPGQASSGRRSGGRSSRRLNSGLDSGGIGGGSSGRKGGSFKKKDKIVVKGGGGSSGFRGLPNNSVEGSTSSSRGKKKVVGRLKGVNKKQNKKTGNVKVNTKLNKESDKKQKKKKFRMTASAPKKDIKIEEAKWDFGDYIRYLIIAGIVVFLIFILGTQIMNAKNAQD